MPPLIGNHVKTSSILRISAESCCRCMVMLSIFVHLSSIQEALDEVPAAELYQGRLVRGALCKGRRAAGMEPTAAGRVDEVRHGTLDGVELPAHGVRTRYR